MAESSDLVAPLQMLAIEGSTTDATKDVTRDVITRKKYSWEEEEDCEKVNSPISYKKLLSHIKKALYLNMKTIAETTNNGVNKYICSDAGIDLNPNYKE